MKKIKIISLALAILLFSINTDAQPDFTPLNTISTDLNTIHTNVPATDVVTNRGLNNFLAKKLSYYISGTKDLSLYEFNTAVDIVDGRFTFNWTEGFRNHATNDTKLKALVSLGLETDGLQGIGKIWNGNDGWNDDIGFNVKLTVPLISGIYSTQTQRDNMKAERLLLLSKIQDDIARDRSQFQSGYNSISTLYPAIATNKTTAFIAKEREKYTTKFFEDEADALSDGELETYNLSYMLWTSIYGYIPATTKKDAYIENLNDTIKQNKIYRGYVNADMNLFIESSRLGSIVFKIGYEGKMINEITANKVDKIDIDQFKQLSKQNDTAILALIKQKQPFNGSVTNKFLHGMNVQLTIFPKGLKYFGLNFIFNPVFNAPSNAVKYPAKFIIGLPISIPAGKDDKRVNIEPQLVINDMFKESDPSKSIKSKLTFGFKIGLPFGSNIYPQ